MFFFGIHREEVYFIENSKHINSEQQNQELNMVEFVGRMSREREK